MTVIALVAPMPHFNPDTRQWELPAGTHPCHNGLSRPTKAPTAPVFSGVDYTPPNNDWWGYPNWSPIKCWKQQSKRLRQHR